MGLQGRGFFIWKVWDCAGGNAERIASAAQSAGLSHVLIKIADGSNPVNIDKETKIDLVPPVVAALQARGIQAWGWHYVYGDDPIGEARVAVQRVQELNLQGYVIDAEIQYKQPGRAAAARRYMNELRRSLTSLPIALSSYRFPTYHPELPWHDFLEQCDYNMPQVYWEKSHNPADQLARTVKEFQAQTPYRPVIPTAPTYKWDGWRPTDQDIKEFLQAAKKLHLPAVNFFSWDECERDLKNLWDLIAEKPPQKPPEEPTKDIPHQWIEALNKHDPNAVVSLYQPNAVQITAARTIQGQAALSAWYQDLFTKTLPDAKFSLTSFSGSGRTRHVTWGARSAHGSIKNGKDTFGLLDGKIIYHYTTYTIST